MFHKALVVLQQDRKDDSKLLERLQWLVAGDASLTLMLLVRSPLGGLDYRFLTPEIRHQVRHGALSSARDYVEDLASDLRARGYNVCYELPWVTDGAAELLCDQIERSRHDLILMACDRNDHHHPTTDLRRFLRLNQFCHTCLVVPDPPLSGPVLAGVDTTHRDVDEQLLASAAIRDATRAAQRGQSSLVIATISPERSLINKELDQFIKADSVNRLIDAEHRERLTQLMATAGCDGSAKTVVVQGEPDQALIRLTRECSARLLVIGRSAAPSGLRGIWRTTLLEKLLCELSCDLLIVPSRIPV